MYLDQWLRQVYEEDIFTKEASNLEALFDQMNPSDLLDIACGRTTIEKVAAKMTLERREALPAKSFAVPETKAKKIGVAGEIKGEAKGKYPIPDIKHAKNALARVSQHGTPGERQAVRSKVYSKFPGLKEGFEERHGESPTAKENVKKVEQGGIGKTSAVKLAFVDRMARELARTHYQVKIAQEEEAAKAEGGKSEEKKEGMTKEDEFTTPEAQAKARVMQKSMQMAKGAPAPVRKGMVQVAAKEMKKAGSIKDTSTRARLMRLMGHLR